MFVALQRSRVLIFAGACCIAASGCDNRNQAGVDEIEPSDVPRSVVALGRLEPAGGIIAISAIPGERLQSFAAGVEEDAVVSAGSELAVLASFDLRNKQYLALDTRKRLAETKRKHDKAVAQAQLDQAQAALAQAQAKLQEVRSQEGKLTALGEAAAIAGEDYRLLAELQGEDPELVTPHQLRKQRNATDQARREHEAAQENFPMALAAALRGVAAAEANVRLAEQNIKMLDEMDETEALAMEVDAAKATRDQSKLVAPGKPSDETEYHILKTHLRPGEFITQMPVMQIADLSEMVCIAEVYEADVKEISDQQKATIESAAFSSQFPKGLRGTVERIGSLVSSPGLINRNPLAPNDRSIVEVVIRIDDQLSREHQGDAIDGEPSTTATEEAAARVGLQVTVRFDAPEGETAAASKSQPPEADATDE